MPVSVDFLVRLPLELVLVILTYLDVRDTVRCRTVSRRWREILDQLDHYWCKAREQLGIPLRAVEEYSSGPGLPQLVLAGLKHRQWVASRRPKVGEIIATRRDDTLCDVRRLGMLRGSLGITSTATCLIGNGCVLWMDSNYRCLLVKRVCPESKRLIEINLLDSAFIHRKAAYSKAVIWAKATVDYILLLTASGLWIVYCLLSRKILVEWMVPHQRKPLKADGSYLHIVCCDKCFLVVSASSFSCDSPVWELSVMKLGKGSPVRSVISQCTLLIRLHPGECVVQWYIYPVSDLSDENGFCFTHTLICHSDTRVFVFSLELIEPELKLRKTAEVRVPSCKCYVLDKSTLLPQVLTSCLSADYQLLAAVVKDCHFIVWDTKSWQVCTSVHLNWVLSLGGVKAVRLLAVGHLYSVIAVSAALVPTVDVHVLSTPSGQLIKKASLVLQFRLPLIGGLLDLQLVNEDWLNSVHCYNSPFLIFLAPRTHQCSVIKFIQF